MSGNQIIISNDIFDWDWFDDAAVFRFYMGLVLMAFTDTTGRQKSKSKEGSVVTSIRKLALFFDMTDSRVRRCIRCLESTGDIKCECTNKNRTITILKPEKYFKFTEEELEK